MDTNISISIYLTFFLQIQLDIKYARDPEIKLPIVVLLASEDPAMKQPPASAAFGFEAFGNLNQPAWSTAPRQQAAPQPMDPPPPYGAYAMYPLFTEPNKYGSAM